MSSRFTETRLVFGHRGARAIAGVTNVALLAENTLPAFALAESAGADGIELDVRLTRDEDVLVFHDPTLERMTAGRDRRVVAELAVAEVTAIDLDGGGRAPRLAEVLAWCKERRLAVNVELKHDGGHLWRLAVRTAEIARRSGADVLFSSFDPRLLAYVAVAMPRAPRAWLLHPTRRWSRPAARALARRALLYAIHPERSQVDRSFVRAMKARGVRVGAWTVNDPAEAARFYDWGVDWCITDDVARLIPRR
ncbi:glycerophosphodiester phosphodiesterase [soil metagenome]